MKITNLNVKNKFIDFKSLSFDFTNTGIYRLSGANGSGKTSIMENIVFGKYSVEFFPLELKNDWDKNRNWLFSYIPQEITQYNLSVAEYLSKGNASIKMVDVYSLLKEFELSECVLHEKFFVLSGGEKKKLQIICGILKDTPYLFIDEPTNNLDNASVENFLKILFRLSQQKTIILISHDDRLQCKENAIYHIDKQLEVRLNYDSSEKRSNFSVKNKTKPKLVKLLISILRNYSQIVTISILCCIYMVLGIISHMDLQNNLNIEDMPRPNIILVQASTYYDAKICDNYIEGERLSVDKEKYEKYIDYNDIHTGLLKQNGIEKLFFTDYKYQNEIAQKITDGNIDQELNFIACPKEYYDDFWDNCLIDYGINLINGVIPTDNENEVAISKKLLCMYFGYTEHNVDEAIGDIININVNGTESGYCVVGFTYFDYAMLSYNPANNFGVYCYSEDTYETFGMQQISYENSVDGWPGMVREMIVVTTDGYERSVLNYLIENYPAGIFYSNHFASVWSKTYNTDIFFDLLIPIITISAILSIAFILINRYSFRYNFAILRDFGNYYINRNKLITIYKASIVGLFLLTTCITFLLNTFFSPFSYISNLYFLISSAIILIPSFLFIIIRKKVKS